MDLQLLRSVCPYVRSLINKTILYFFTSLTFSMSSFPSSLSSFLSTTYPVFLIYSSFLFLYILYPSNTYLFTFSIFLPLLFPIFSFNLQFFLELVYLALYNIQSEICDLYFPYRITVKISSLRLPLVFQYLEITDCFYSPVQETKLRERNRRIGVRKLYLEFLRFTWLF